ncbi:hypothetical protein EIN_111660, partial [Entamoeba invadens IP1]
MIIHPFLLIKFIEKQEKEENKKSMATLRKQVPLLVECRQHAAELRTKRRQEFLSLKRVIDEPTKPSSQFYSDEQFAQSKSIIYSKNSSEPDLLDALLVLKSFPPQFEMIDILYLLLNTPSEKLTVATLNVLIQWSVSSAFSKAIFQSHRNFLNSFQQILETLGDISKYHVVWLLANLASEPPIFRNMIYEDFVVGMIQLAKNTTYAPTIRAVVFLFQNLLRGDPPIPESSALSLSEFQLEMVKTGDPEIYKDALIGFMLLDTREKTEKVKNYLISKFQFLYENLQITENDASTRNECEKIIFYIAGNNLLFTGTEYVEKLEEIGFLNFSKNFVIECGTEGSKSAFCWFLRNLFVIDDVGMYQLLNSKNLMSQVMLLIQTTKHPPTFLYASQAFLEFFTYCGAGEIRRYFDKTLFFLTFKRLLETKEVQYHKN